MNEVKELLLDVVGMHSYLGEVVTVLMIVFFNLIYIVKKKNLFNAIFINVISIILSYSFFVNSIRLFEWANWYISSTDIYNKFNLSMHIDGIIAFAALAFLIVDTVIYFYRKKHNLNKSE